jgi:S-(hydroxymethyl)mycothiol dehydrogenase
MPSTVRGVVARSPKSHTEVVGVVIPNPVGHDVVVRVQA